MIRFYKNKNIYFVISSLIILIGIVFMFINGVRLSILFKGGAILKYSYVGEIDINEVSKLSSDVLDRITEVQQTEDIATKSRKVVLNLSGNSGLSAQEQDILNQALLDKFPNNNLALAESNIVEPFIGKTFLRNSIIAILISAVMIVVYVWIRFKKISGLSAGIAALIALFHDVLISFFIFVIFRIPLNDSFIAVVLTIIGFSVNDTIVIYDRIRENKTLFPRMDVEDLVDLSITQSMSRSINTTVATVISTIVLYIFAQIYDIESIKSFALPMAFGLISGCYSTICIAGPIWVMWQKKKNKTA
jgi:preprotein translocase SecF subunit